MLNLQEYTYLIIFPDGNFFKGYKLPNIDSHYKILEKMGENYPSFGQLINQYEIQNHKQQIKMYTKLVNDGAIIYHSWSTYIEEDPEDTNLYLPNKITSEQKEFMTSIMEQLNSIPNVIPHELCDNGYLKMSNYESYEGAQYTQNFIESNLIKSK